MDSGEASKFIVEVKDKQTPDVEYVRLAIKLEQEKQRSEQMKKVSMDTELQMKKVSMDVELQMKKDSMDAELEKEKKELEIETQALLERKRQEFQFEQAKLNYEAQVAKQVEESKSKLSIESKRRELELEANQPTNFDLTKCIKLVPKFEETEVDVFFKNFEDMASYMKWPIEQWVWLVKSKLVGKAATIVGSLVGELNYEVIKQAILNAYAVTSEGYHQQFRNYIKPYNKTWTEFAAEKLRLLQKWLKSENLNNFD